MWQRAVRTAELAAIALVVATIVGLPIGVLTGARPSGWLATIVVPISSALIACPPLVGVLALLWLAVMTGWLSTEPGRVMLPAIALALPLAAALERLQARATADTLDAVDLTAAAARGIPRWRRLWVHAARQSLRPVLGVYGLAIGGLLSGSLAVEIVTSWPGLARLTMDALQQRDSFLVAGCALFAAVFIAAGNLAADVLRAIVDPRVSDADVNPAARAGAAVLAIIAATALLAPVLAPHSGREQFADRAYAPPMRLHVRGPNGWQRPFVYRQVIEDRIGAGRTARTARRRSRSRGSRAGGWRRSPTSASRCCCSARTRSAATSSRGCSTARSSRSAWRWPASSAPLAIGGLAGAIAGSLGGPTDSILMLIADFLLVLPGAYLVLVLRSLLPDVLSTAEVFALMAALFAIAAWPHTARGVRAIVQTERRRDYAEAARAIGAGPFRLARHLLPAASGFLAVEIGLLIPALLIAEATLSFLGLGFPEPRPSWGTMLQEAANIRVIDEAPWMLAPAAALFVVVLGVQLLAKKNAVGTGH